jgi:tetratricopeptide (TPR) repeat protein
LERFSEALDSYDEALKLEPKNAELWYNKAKTFEKLDKPHEAIESYDEALRIDLNHVDAWYSRGMVMVNLGKNKEALECFDKALELNPDFEPALKAKKDISNIKS